MKRGGNLEILISLNFFIRVSVCCLSIVSSPWFLRLKRKKNWCIGWRNFLQQPHTSFFWILDFGLGDELLIFPFSPWILMLESIFWAFWIDKFIMHIFCFIRLLIFYLRAEIFKFKVACTKRKIDSSYLFGCLVHICLIVSTARLRYRKTSMVPLCFYL